MPTAAYGYFIRSDFTRKLQGALEPDVGSKHHQHRVWYATV